MTALLRSSSLSTVILILEILTICEASAAIPVSCPPKLERISEKLDTEVQGWNSSSAPTQHLLDSFMVFDGPPQRLMNEIYNDERTFTEKKLRFHALSWDLKQIKEPWIQCGYFGTSLVLARPLRGYSTCTAVMLEDIDQTERMKDVECK